MPFTVSHGAIWIKALLLLVLQHENRSSFCFSLVHHYRRHTFAAAIRIRPLARQHTTISARASKPKDRAENIVCGAEGGQEPSIVEHSYHETLSSLSEKLDQIVQNDQPAVDDSHIARSCRLSLVRTRLEHLQLNRTMLGTSTIAGAGRGLFCACDSKEGDLLTCYPGDALVTIPDFNEDGNTGGGFGSSVEYTVLWGNHVPQKDQTESLDENLRGYLLHAQENYGVLGLPSMDADPAYLGHFVNDGGQLLSQKGFTDYILDSFENANAKHRDVQDGSHMVLIATRDLTKGEEIFVTYGPEYWMDQPCFVDDGGSIYGDAEDE